MLGLFLPVSCCCHISIFISCGVVTSQDRLPPLLDIHDVSPWVPLGWWGRHRFCTLIWPEPLRYTVYWWWRSVSMTMLVLVQHHGWLEPWCWTTTWSPTASRAGMVDQSWLLTRVVPQAVCCGIQVNKTIENIYLWGTYLPLVLCHVPLLLQLVMETLRNGEGKVLDEVMG